MTRKKAKAELTDAERHKRFVELAREVGADESAESFNRAFDKVVSKPTRQQSKKRRRSLPAS